MKKDTKLPFSKLTTGNSFRLLLGVPYGLISAFLLADIIQFAIQGELQQLFLQCVGLVILALLFHTVDYLIGVRMQIRSEVVKHGFKESLLTGYFTQDIHSLSATNKGELIEHLHNDVNEIMKYFTQSLPVWITGLVTALAYMGYFAYVNIWVCLLMIFISMLHVIPPVLIKKYMQKNYLDAREIEARLTNHVLSGYRGFQTLQVYAAHSWFLGRLSTIHKDYNKIGQKAEKTITVEQGMAASLDHIVKFGTYGIVAFLMVGNGGDLKAGLAVLTLSTGFYQAVARMFGFVAERQVYHTAMARLKEMMAPSPLAPRPNFSKVEQQPVLDISGLPVGSPGDETVLHIKIGEKDRVLLQGSNGSGKSTLLNVLLRRKRYDRGKVQYKGSELSLISEEAYFREISWLPQEDYLLSITPEQLYQIMFHDDTGVHGEVLYWCEKLGITKELRSRRSIRDLSGGERKKVYIIAALLKSASIILLDEPENYLDKASRDVLEQWIKGLSCTLLIVSHKDWFREYATTIIKLEQREKGEDKRNEAHA